MTEHVHGREYLTGLEAKGKFLRYIAVTLKTTTTMVGGGGGELFRTLHTNNTFT
jgi:hypothetical protein